MHLLTQAYAYFSHLLCHLQRIVQDVGEFISPPKLLQPQNRARNRKTGRIQAAVGNRIEHGPLILNGKSNIMHFQPPSETCSYVYLPRSVRLFEEKIKF